MTGQPTVYSNITAGRDSALSQEQARSRIQAIQAVLASAGPDAILLNGPENIFWASGRQTAGYFVYQALLIPAHGAPVLLVRELEAPGARASTHIADIRTFGDLDDPATLICDLAAEFGVKTLAVERTAWFVGANMYTRIDDQLSKAGIAAFDGSGLIEALRMVKDSQELEAIRKAAAYADAGMRDGIAACRAGASENEIAAAMLSAAIRAGSETMGMEPLVSSGERAGVPHATWRRRVLQKGDPVFLELAGSHDRYHAALMRSVWIGQPPTEARRMMDCTLRALDAALLALTPGQPCSAAHLAAQSVIAEAGFLPALRKRIGYSMGIAFAPDWGEGAFLSLNPNETRMIEPGMVFHLPVTLRAFGRWTVGVSETVIIKAGGPEPLSDLPRDMTLC